MEYVISETHSGNFVVQRPNGFGGLYPLVPPGDDCRNTLDILDIINADVKEMWRHGAHDNFSVVLRFWHDPNNAFTH